ncbi:MAG TPA: CopD family protein [Methylomirabilota bacterium]|nr:CopD family protein [Methylomirabilota bacterium]
MTAVGLAVRWLHLAAGLFLVGLHTAGLLARRGDKPTARRWEADLGRWGRGAVLIVLASGLALLAWQSAVVTGDARAALQPAAWLRLLGQSQFGTVWLVRHALLLLLAALLFLRQREEGTADWFALRAEAWLLTAAAAGAMAWAGHAAAVEPGALAAALVDAGHLVAAGMWVGALLPLSLLLRAASTEAGADARPYAVLAIRRFSRLALGAVLILAATGAVNAWLQTGGVAAVVGTRYGWLLLAKLGVLAAALVLAALNRRLLPALSGEAVTVGRPAMARLSRFVAGEWMLALGILGLTAALGITPPGRHLPPGWPFSFRLSWDAMAELPGVKMRVFIGAQLAIVGTLAIVIAALLRRRRGVAAGLGLAAVVIGLWVALPPLAVDAYPTTYRRSGVPYQAASVASGTALYAAHCVTCHGKNGTGDGSGGAGLPKRPADLTAPHTAQHTAGDLYWWISHGIQPSGMPAFADKLSEEARWDLINFLRGLSAAARARSLRPALEPNRPWLVAPDFTFRVGPTPARTLKEFRDRWMVLLVLFSLPESRPRLAQLAEAYSDLQFSGTEVLAVPDKADPGILKVLGARPPLLFPVVTEGAAEIADTYGLFARDGLAAPAPPHAEFLIDRQGYVRARWIPGAGGKGWSDIKTLLDEIRILDREAPSAPPPEEHVH